MAIAIRVESSWDTDDGEGRSIEVSVAERKSPWEDVEEDSFWFAGGDTEALKRFLCRLVDEKVDRFLGRELRECTACRRLTRTESLEVDFRCPACTR